jgi:hypothetical protein
MSNNVFKGNNKLLHIDSVSQRCTHNISMRVVLTGNNISRNGTSNFSGRRPNELRELGKIDIHVRTRGTKRGSG